VSPAESALGETVHAIEEEDKDKKKMNANIDEKEEIKDEKEEQQMDIDKEEPHSSKETNASDEENMDEDGAEMEVDPTEIPEKTEEEKDAAAEDKEESSVEEPLYTQDEVLPPSGENDEAIEEANEQMFQVEDSEGNEVGVAESDEEAEDEKIVAASPMTATSPQKLPDEEIISEEDVGIMADKVETENSDDEVVSKEDREEGSAKESQLLSAAKNEQDEKDSNAVDEAIEEAEPKEEEGDAVESDEPEKEAREVEALSTKTTIGQRHKEIKYSDVYVADKDSIDKEDTGMALDIVETVEKSENDDHTSTLKTADEEVREEGSTKEPQSPSSATEEQVKTVEKMALEGEQSKKGMEDVEQNKSRMDAREVEAQATPIIKYTDVETPDVPAVKPMGDDDSVSVDSSAISVASSKRRSSRTRKSTDTVPEQLNVGLHTRSHDVDPAGHTRSHDAKKEDADDEVSKEAESRGKKKRRSGRVRSDIVETAPQEDPAGHTRSHDAKKEDADDEVSKEAESRGKKKRRSGRVRSAIVETAPQERVDDDEETVSVASSAVSNVSSVLRRSSRRRKTPAKVLETFEVSAPPVALPVVKEDEEVDDATKNDEGSLPLSPEVTKEKTTSSVTVPTRRSARKRTIEPADSNDEDTHSIASSTASERRGQTRRSITTQKGKEKDDSSVASDSLEVTDKARPVRKSSRKKDDGSVASSVASERKGRPRRSTTAQKGKPKVDDDSSVVSDMSDEEDNAQPTRKTSKKRVPKKKESFDSAVSAGSSTRPTRATTTRSTRSRKTALALRRLQD